MLISLLPRAAERRFWLVRVLENRLTFVHIWFP